MKTILSCLMLIVAFPFISSSDEPHNIINLPKNSLTSNKNGFSGAILLPASGIRNVDMIAKAQQKYIKKLYPDHHVVLSVYIKDQKNRYIEAVSCVNSDDEMVQVYFDMTDVYKNLKNKNGKSRLAIEKLEKSYITVK